MAVKYLDLPGVGRVGLYKRRGVSSIKLSVTSTGDIRVSMPQWMPYKAAIAFASSQHQWILDHQKPIKVIKTGTRLGKSYYFRVVRSDEYPELEVKIVGGEIRIYCSNYLEDIELTLKNPKIQKIANKALKREADNILPDRLESLASLHDYSYNDLKIRHLKSRWGSCDQHKNITLNYFLVQLPWELIDYVLIHELSHTKVLSHGPNFWEEVVKSMPDWKQRRRELKKYEPSVLLQGQ
jgi:predicted metal-dependent hydrolase